MKKACIIFLMCILSVASVHVSAASFSDISGHWAEDTIERWSNRNVINGYNGHFEPDGELTRAQMATILSNLLGLTLKSKNIYADVPVNAWYADAVLKCTYAGIMNGDGINANPDLPITREAAMVMIARALNIDIEYSIKKTVADLPDISAWAKWYVYAMINSGYVNGVGNNMIKPLDNISRASVITILDNIIKMYIDTPGEYEIAVDYSGKAVLKGNGIIIKTENENIDIIISKEYTYELVSNAGTTTVYANFESVTVSTGGDSKSKKYVVSFYDGFGSLINQQEVMYGKAAIPPDTPSKNGYIFNGWNADFSHVNTDMNINAEWIDISTKNNCFVIPTTLVSKGSVVRLPLLLTGNVELCGFDLSIIFDREALDFVTFESVDDDIVLNYNEDSGIIHVNFSSSVNISGEIDIGNMMFEVLKNNTVTAVEINVIECIKIVNEGDFEKTAYETHNGEVVFY